MISPPDAIIGQNVRQWAIRLLAYIKSERVLSGDGILVKQTASGKTVSLAANQWAVRVAGRKITITGTRARYIWVYFTESPVRAEWSNADGGDPFPDGVEVYDTHVNEIHIPRIG